MSDYQSIAKISQEWLAKARKYMRCAEQEEISDEEALLYRTSAEQYIECAKQLAPFKIHDRCSEQQARVSVERERKTMEERKRYEAMSTEERCRLQGDGFINDYD